MSYSGRIDSPAHWVKYGAKWFLLRLSIYVAVAVVSACLFFVGASVYEILSLLAYDLALATFAAFAIAAIILLSRFGWPRLRLRTCNKFHGGVRVIEISLVLSHARPTGPLALAGRLAHALQVAFRRPALGAAVPSTVQNDRTSIDRTTRVYAECIVYVTLKFDNS